MESIVTIGVCVRNGEATIGTAMESIITQSYPHELLEIIVVDDGSKDKTLQVIREHFLQSNITLKIISIDEKGLGFARNLVVENACGEYIVWVDSDNILTNDFVKKQVNFMEKNKQVGIAAGKIWVHPDDNVILTLELAPLIAKCSHRATLTALDTEVTKLPGTAGAICRIDLIRKAGGFDKSITGAGEDQDVATRIRNMGWSIGFTDAIFYETHGCMTNYKQLWNKYIWYGHSAFPLYYRGLYKISILLMNPFAGVISGLKVATKTYPVIYKKSLFLSPIHYGFKMIAYLRGFNKAKANMP